MAKVCTNQLEKDHSMIEKSCDFYPDNFKFYAVKKNYKDNM